MGLGGYGYALGQKDACELSPMAGTSLKEPTMPLRPCWVTSVLVGKAYEAWFMLVRHCTL